MTVSPEASEVNITTKSSVSLSPDDAKRFVSMIESRERTAEWHPLVSRVSSADDTAKDAPQEWEGIVAGIPVRGVSEVTEWEPGRVYGFRNIERSTGLSVDSRFVLSARGDQIVLSAVASFNVPKEASALLDHAQISRFLSDGVEQALINLGAVARGDKVAAGSS